MTKKSKTRERIWNLKIFQQKTITKEEIETDMKVIKD